MQTPLQPHTLPGLHGAPLNNGDGAPVFRWLLDVCERTAGPCGSSFAAPSGLVKVTSDSTEALRCLTESMKIDQQSVASMDSVGKRLILPHHPFTRLAVQHVTAHTRRFGDGGWSLLHMICWLCGNGASGAGWQPPLRPAILKVSGDIIRSWVRAFFYDTPPLRPLRPDGASGLHLVTLVATLLRTNTTLALTPAARASLASKLLRLYLLTADTPPSAGAAAPSPGFRLLGVVVPLGSAAPPSSPLPGGEPRHHRSAPSLQADILPGVLLEWGLPLEWASLSESRLRKAIREDGCRAVTGGAVGGGQPIKVALFDICLEPDTQDTVLLTQNPRDSVSILEGGLPGDPSGEEKEGGGGYRPPQPPGSPTPEMRNLFSLADAVASAEPRIGAVLSQKTIHEAVRSRLARAGILCLDRLSIRHIHAVRRLTGATVLSSASPEGLRPAALGELFSIAEVRFSPGGKKHIHLQGTRGEEGAFHTMVLRHCFAHVLSEAESTLARAMHYVAQMAPAALQAAGGGGGGDPPIEARVLPGCGVWQRLLAAFIAARLEAAPYATRGVLGRVAGGPLLAEVSRVASALRGALRRFADVAEAGLGAGGAAAGEAELRAVGPYRVPFLLHAFCEFGVPPLKAQRHLLLAGGGGCRTHACDPPPGARFCGLRTAVRLPGGGGGVPGVDGVEAEGGGGCPAWVYPQPVLPAVFPGVLRGKGAGRAKRLPDSGVCSAVAGFGAGGLLEVPDAPEDFPVVDSANEKLHAVLSALDLFNLLSRADSMLIDTN